jgi:hypothetical protein
MTELTAFRWCAVYVCSGEQLDLAAFTQGVTNEPISLPMKFCSTYLDSHKALRNSPHVNEDLRPVLHVGYALLPACVECVRMHKSGERERSELEKSGR